MGATLGRVLRVCFFGFVSLLGPQSPALHSLLSPSYGALHVFVDCLDVVLMLSSYLGLTKAPQAPQYPSGAVPGPPKAPQTQCPLETTTDKQ